MNVLLRSIDVLSLAVGPFLLLGIITRVKALWAGRKGAPLLQPLFDCLRLMRKGVVRGRVTTPLVWIGPLIAWVTSVAAALFMPALSGLSLLDGRFDFIVVAYLFGLGRMAMILSALDTGSSFEAMGASREATLGTLAEPVFFLVMGALVAGSGESSLQGMLGARDVLPGVAQLAAFFLLIASFALLQVEAARMPVDDPTTHLELTMIHEVMILDHSGVDLAVIQHATALKTFVWSELIVFIALPSPTGIRGAALHALGMLGVAVVVGLVESTIARLKLQALPRFLFVAMAAACIGLLLTSSAASGPVP